MIITANIVYLSNDTNYIKAKMDFNYKLKENSNNVQEPDNSRNKFMRIKQIVALMLTQNNNNDNK